MSSSRWSPDERWDEGQNAYAQTSQIAAQRASDPTKKLLRGPPTLRTDITV